MIEKSPLILCNKKCYKKFAAILIVCQRWCHSEKPKLSINFWSRRDFDLQSFWKVILFEGVSVEKVTLHAFSGIQYHL